MVPWAFLQCKFWGRSHNWCWYKKVFVHRCKIQVLYSMLHSTKKNIPSHLITNALKIGQDLLHQWKLADIIVTVFRQSESMHGV